MIDINQFYIAAGLLPIEEWETRRLAYFREQVFKMIPDFIVGKVFDNPDINRRSGKTTRVVIESLYAEWYGYNTAIVCNSVIDQCVIKSLYQNYKNKILSKFGPAVNPGKTCIITKSSINYYSGYKILLDLY